MRYYKQVKNHELEVNHKDRNQGKEIETQAEEPQLKKDQILHFNYKI